MKKLRLLALSTTLMMSYSCADIPDAIKLKIPSVEITVPSPAVVIKEKPNEFLPAPAPTATPTPFVTPTPNSTPYNYPTPTPVMNNNSDDFSVMKVYAKTVNILMASTDQNDIYHDNIHRVNMQTGEVQYFYTDVFSKNGIKDNDVIWTSSDNNIAGIDQNGNLYAYREGKVTITATSRKYLNMSVSFSCSVFNNLTHSSYENCNESITEERFPKVNEEQTGYTTIDRERATFTGKIYDQNGNTVEGATVTVKTADNDCNRWSWVTEPQITVGGAYVFRNAPVGAKIEITAEKFGYTTRTQTQVIKSNLSGDPNINVFDFKDNYAIQDRPEITSLKINGTTFTKSTQNDYFYNNKPIVTKYNNITEFSNNTSGYIPAITGVFSNNGAEIEMVFSDSVRHDDIENYFRLSSENLPSTKIPAVFDHNTTGVSFTWSDDNKKVVFRTNQPIPSNKSGAELRYTIDFTHPFRALNSKEAIPQKYFRFSNSQINEFAVFSVQNN